MKLSHIKFACTSLNGTNKVGNLFKDADGYYEMVIGGLNIFNSAGQWYSYEGAKELFESSSQFMRRIKRGALRGEVGHPRREAGQSFDDYVNRILEIRETNVCVQFKEIYLDFNKIKDANGKAVVAIMAKLIPSGPFGPMLEKSLNNKNENVCFSIRSFTKDYRDRGIEVRDIKNIVTFDMVNEPGIHIAEKYKTPSLETLSETFVTQQQIQRALTPSSSHGIASESAMASAKDLFDSMGWKLPENVVPAFTKW